MLRSTNTSARLSAVERCINLLYNTEIEIFRVYWNLLIAKGFDQYSILFFPDLSFRKSFWIYAFFEEITSFTPLLYSVWMKNSLAVAENVSALFWIWLWVRDIFVFSEQYMYARFYVYYLNNVCVLFFFIMF